MKNYDQYRTLTEKHDWAGICKLNGIDIKPIQNLTAKEMKALPDQLQEGEVVFAFTAGIIPNLGDGNSTDLLPSTWLVVLTDRRFLFLDAALLSNSIDVHSILHKNVQGVLATQGFLLGKISIETGSRSTIVDNCRKATVKIIGDLANDWLQVLEERKSAPQAPAGPEETGLDKLKKLAALKELGVVTQEEFDAAKAKVLAEL